MPEARVPELKPSVRGDSGKKSYIPLIYTEAVYFFLGTRLPCQADTHTDTHAQVSWGQWGEEGWDEQMLHPAAAPDARAEVAGPDPALCAVPLRLRVCLISVQRQSRDPQVSANSPLQGQGRSAVSKTRCTLWRRALRQLQPLEGMITDTSKKHILLPQQTASALPHSILPCPVPEEPQLFLCCDRGS